jgi:glucose/arabinose dehydrogenase/PKD repeat protein
MWGRRGVGLAVAVLVVAASLALVGASDRAEAADVPVGFVDEVVLGGGLELPTNVALSPDGRVFVAEKSGLIKLYDSLSDPTPSVFADLRTQVFNFGDLGMTGLALHPTFPTTPYVYVSYVHDAPIGGTAPTYGVAGQTFDNCTAPTDRGCLASGRVSRLTATGNTGGSELVLVEDWCQAGSSGHAMQEVRFGPDGMLYVGAGDGARANPTDYGQFGNLCNDPPGGTMAPPTAEGGSLRAQDVRTAGDPVGLDGTLIRINPNTGAGLADNPRGSSTSANERRIVAHGLRNPFRFTWRPGTEEIWIADVGWRTREEINRLVDPSDATLDNFGWPCFEGAVRETAWDALDLNMCETLYTAGGQAAPYLAYRHVDKVSPGGCDPGAQGSVSAPIFYTGTAFPAEYRNAFFFGDYARQCLWVMFPGANGLPDTSTVREFSTLVGGIVDIEQGADGALYYVDIIEGTVHRIRYTGSSNRTPTAVAHADRTSGPAPLAVQFHGDMSSDPDGDALTYAWDLDGDGAFDDSTTANPARTYTTAGSVTVRLRVTDTHGASATATLVITVGTAGPGAPVPTITAPTSTTTWYAGQTLTFRGTATDPQDGTLPASALDWTVTLFHCPDAVNCHQHPVGGAQDVATGSFVAPDHEYFAYLEIGLTATDSSGNTATVTRRLDPQTRTITVQSNPAGIPIGLNDEVLPAPYTRTVIRYATNTVNAPLTAQLNGRNYRFDHWSDNGAAVHDVKPNLNTTRIAYYVLAPPTTTNRALLVVGSPTAPNAGDRAIADRLRALGLDVTLADDNGISAAAASGMQLVVVSSTVTPTNVNATFAGTAVPVIVAEHALYDDFGMTADTGAHNVSAARTNVALTTAGAAHPIGAGLTAGQVVVTTSAQKLTWGRPAATATKVATQPAYATNVTVFAYPAGAQMVGRAAPARRVGLFLTDLSASVLTADGGRLFDNAVQWARGV